MGKQNKGGKIISSESKAIHWICFIAGKYSVWYNHDGLAGICGVGRLIDWSTLEQVPETARGFRMKV